VRLSHTILLLALQLLEPAYLLAESAAPEPPALVAPVAGAKVSHRAPIVMNWMPVRGVREYRLEIDRLNRQTATKVFRQKTPGTSLAAPGTQLGPGTYRWRVVALDGRGGEGASEWRRFTLS
jgi:hypothetical protein